MLPTTPILRIVSILPQRPLPPTISPTLQPTPKSQATNPNSPNLSHQPKRSPPPGTSPGQRPSVPLESETNNSPSPAESATSATRAEPKTPNESQPENSNSQPSPDTLNFPAHLDEDLCQDALDLLSDPSTKSPLDALPDHQRKAIFELLQAHSTRRVSQLLAEPPPLGLSLKIGKSSLARFKDRYQFEARAKKGLENIDAITQTFAKDGQQTEDKLHLLTQRVLASRLFTCSSDPQYDPRKINLLVRSLNSLRRQRLLEKKTHIELLNKVGWPESNSNPTAPPDDAKR
jgi:hypothetical protein